MDNVDKLALVKEILDRRGVTQTKLAELLGINLTTVNNWFRRGSIPEKYLNNIAMLFNLKIPSDKSLIEFDIDENRPEKVLKSNNSSGYVTLMHINSKNSTIFNVDKMLIGLKDLDSIRFNHLNYNTKNVDIIDINVDIYSGDGIYYIKYPHGIVRKKVIYNFNINTYTVIDFEDSALKLEVNNIDGKLAGKVIARIEIFN